MRRYLIFAGGHVPAGGWHDYCGALDGLEAAKAFARVKARNPGNTWAQVVDTVTGLTHDVYDMTASDANRVAPETQHQTI
jgi:hypothetical protein